MPTKGTENTSEMEKWSGSSIGYRAPAAGGTMLRKVRTRSSPSPVTFEVRKIGHALDVTKLEASSHAMPTSLTNTGCFLQPGERSTFASCFTVCSRMSDARPK